MAPYSSSYPDVSKDSTSHVLGHRPLLTSFSTSPMMMAMSRSLNFLAKRPSLIWSYVSLCTNTPSDTALNVWILLQYLVSSRDSIRETRLTAS